MVIVATRMFSTSAVGFITAAETPMSAITARYPDAPACPTDEYNNPTIKNFAAQWGIDKYDSAVIDAVMRLVNEERIAIVKPFGTNILCRTQKRSAFFLIQTHESCTLWRVYDGDKHVGNLNLIAIFIGLVSSIVDNVPLVAAGIKMYPFEMDHPFWQFLGYTAGSCLIIGSAAGVAAMGMEKTHFLWYFRKISPWALLGYLSGAGVYVLIEPLFGTYH